MDQILLDTSLQELSKHYRISDRALKVCQTAGLTDVRKLIYHYLEFKSFTRFLNSGYQTDKELVRLSKVLRKRLNVDLPMDRSNDGLNGAPPLNELETGGLSVRAINICRANGLVTFEKIASHFATYKNFANLRNCGLKTEEELIEISRHFTSAIKKEATKSTNSQTIDAFDKLTPFKKALLKALIDHLSSTLSVRGRNGFSNYFLVAPNLREIVEKLFDPFFDFYSIKNIGKKTVDELVALKKQVEEFINTLETFDDKQLSKEYLRLVLKMTFKDIPSEFYHELEKLFDENNKIKVFHLLHLLIHREQIFNVNEKRIFCHFFTSNDGQSIDELSTLTDLTKERIRQIKIVLEETLPSYFSFVQNLSLEDLVVYDINQTQACMVVDEEFASRINKAEECIFNPKFFAIAFGMLLHKTHTLLQETDANLVKYRKSRSLDNYFLIKTVLLNGFSFDGLRNDVVQKASGRITESYPLYFDGYLSQFQTKYDKDQAEDIRQVAETLIFQEFDLVVNGSGYLIFEKNTRKTMAEYVFDILEELDRMANIEEIALALKERYDGIENSEQAVRSTVLREKDLFICIGRTSTYGLRKWEGEREYLKGGTIRDLVEDYLANEEEPKHIYEIVQHVKKFRNTTDISVKRNIDMEGGRRFQFFPGEYVGLAARHYQNTHKFKGLRGVHFTKFALRKLEGWPMEKVIDFFVMKYHYQPIQVKSAIDRRVQVGDLSFNTDNKLTVCHE